MLCDTNILIAYLNGESITVAALSQLWQERRALFVSAVTVTELLAHPSLTPKENRRVETFLSFFTILQFDAAVARHAAFFKRTYALAFPDAAIAANAYDRQLPLITRDKHFRKIKEIEVCLW